MNLSIGIVETRGMVTALSIADEMLKEAYVEVIGIEKTSSGFVAVMFSGDLSQVNHAFEIGVCVAEKTGELIAAKVIAKPFPDLIKYKNLDKGTMQNGFYWND